MTRIMKARPSVASLLKSNAEVVELVDTLS